MPRVGVRVSFTREHRQRLAPRPAPSKGQRSPMRVCQSFGHSGRVENEKETHRRCRTRPRFALFILLRFVLRATMCSSCDDMVVFLLRLRVNKYCLEYLQFSTRKFVSACPIMVAKNISDRPVLLYSKVKQQKSRCHRNIERWGRGCRGKLE
jgi:hypothetical protein